MTDDPVTPAKYDAISGYLATQANEAIKAGADAKAVTAKLGEMVAHLHANPELHQHANDAMGHGVDPYEITTKLQGMMSQPEPEKPGLVSRAASQVGGFVKSLAHPVDLATNMAKSIGQSAYDTFAAPVEGETPQSDLAMLHGTDKPVTATTPGAITPKRFREAATQTVVNAATPGVARLGVVGSLASGAASGAVYSPDDPAAGALAGAALAGTARGAGKIAKPFVKAGEAAASKALDLAGRPVDSRPVLTVPVINKPIGRITGLKDMAGDAIGRRAAMDAEAGHVAQPMHKSVPSLALDAAGPNVEGLAEGIANRPGPGRATIVNAVEGRKQIMRPALSKTLEENSGVPATTRMSGQAAALSERAKEAKANYDAARAETQGQPVTSPTFEQITQSTAGKQALKVAMARQGNLFRELPTDIPAPDGFTPEQWKIAQQHMQDRGITMPSVEGSPLPDPETLHIMKQHLRKMAKLGDPNDPVTADAHAVLSVMDKVREELPESWRKADDAYAAHSRIIDMGDVGRKVYSTKINPPSRGAKAVNESLDGLTAKKAAASPEEQAALQQGAAVAAHSRLQAAPKTIKSPSRIFGGGSEERIEQTSHAFPDADKANDFQHAVNSWDRVQQQADRLIGNSRTGLRGAEGSGAMVEPHTLLQRPKAIVKGVVKKIGGEAQKRHQTGLEAQIAKMLASPDVLSLPSHTTPHPPSLLLRAISDGFRTSLNPAVAASDGQRP